ncbi:MAG: helix-hairpin-helix domain-containing protein [Candidatus Dojkabacteria bacterium]
MTKEEILKQFQKIPSVGKAVSEDLYSLGYRSVEDLKDEDPERMYVKLCEQTGIRVDRCMLYTFRCIVYFASNKTHDPEKLKWWIWKD